MSKEDASAGHNGRAGSEQSSEVDGAGSAGGPGEVFATVEFFINGSGGAGWYWREDECPHNGASGPFVSAFEAIEYAIGCVDVVRVRMRNYEITARNRRRGRPVNRPREMVTRLCAEVVRAACGLDEDEAVALDVSPETARDLALAAKDAADQLTREREEARAERDAELGRVNRARFAAADLIGRDRGLCRACGRAHIIGHDSDCPVPAILAALEPGE